MQNEIISLIKEVKAGNKQAFSLLYRLHYPRLFAFLYTLLKDRDLAEEITQDVFFRLWLNREKLQTDCSPDPYLYSIARHTVCKLYRRKEIEARYRDNCREETVEADTEERFCSEELRRLVDEAIEKMPPQQRYVFRLSREEGLANPEIAEKLHISKRTVEKHISNSLRVLRRLIEKNYLLCFFL